MSNGRCAAAAAGLNMNHSKNTRTARKGVKDNINYNNYAYNSRHNARSHRRHHGDDGARFVIRIPPLHYTIRSIRTLRRTAQQHLVNNNVLRCYVQYCDNIIYAITVDTTKPWSDGLFLILPGIGVGSRAHRRNLYVRKHFPSRAQSAKYAESVRPFDKCTLIICQAFYSYVHCCNVYYCNTLY